MSEHLGRTLSAHEIVHHRDGNPYNNALANLEIVDRNRGHIAVHDAKVVAEACRIAAGLNVPRGELTLDEFLANAPLNVRKTVYRWGPWEFFYPNALRTYGPAEGESP